MWSRRFLVQFGVGKMTTVPCVLYSLLLMQMCTLLRWRNAMVKSDVSGLKGLTPFTCLCYRCCALGEGSTLKTRTQRGQAICTSVCLHENPGIEINQKNLLIKKIYHLTTLHLYPAQTRNEQWKSYRILMSSCWPTDIRLFDFYTKQVQIKVIGPNQSHYNQS